MTSFIIEILGGIAGTMWSIAISTRPF